MLLMALSFVFGSGFGMWVSVRGNIGHGIVLPLDSAYVILWRLAVSPLDFMMISDLESAEKGRHVVIAGRGGRLWGYLGVWVCLTACQFVVGVLLGSVAHSELGVLMRLVVYG